MREELQRRTPPCRSTTHFITASANHSVAPGPQAHAAPQTRGLPSPTMRPALYGLEIIVGGAGTRYR